MSWREITHASDRYRYRRSDAPDRDYDVEYWHEGRQEWRAVQNGSSRDWFAIGFRAGLQSAVSDGVQGSLL